MAQKIPQFTKLWHRASYASISPIKPSLTSREKVVLITNGDSGISLRVARSFAQAGARKIVLTGRSREALDTARAKLEAQFDYLMVLAREADPADSEAIGAVFAEAEAKFGSLDVLIDNAEYLNDDTIGSLEVDKWLEEHKFHSQESFSIARAFLKATPEHCTIITITAPWAHLPSKQSSVAYGTSKAAAVRLLQNVEAENPTTRVYHVHPGRFEPRDSATAGNGEGPLLVEGEGMKYVNNDLVFKV